MTARPLTPTRAFTYNRVRDDDGVRRIVVSGGESTGKTTLAQQLAGWLDVPLAPEYSRAYATSIGRALTAHDVELIARGQIQSEDDAIAQARRHPRAVHAPRALVLDTDLLSTVVYAEHYYGSCPSWIVEQARARVGDLYLLARPDLPWEDDGVRDQPTARWSIHQRFVDRLHDAGATVLEVHGKGPSRFANAQAAVRGWRAARATHVPAMR